MPNPGWTVTQIVQQVMGRTENRAANKGAFNPREEFWLGLDQFCQEKHYWWRRKLAALQVTPSVQQYDLSSNGTGQASAGDCVEIEEMFTINALPQTGPINVNPMFSPRAQVAAVYGQPSIGVEIPKGGYFLDGFQNLTFSSPPQETVTVAFTYYAVPMVQNISADVVPLVPPNLHYGLFDMLEVRIMKFLYSQSDPRCVAAQKSFDDFKIVAAKGKSFSSQEAIEMRSNQPAVQSNGGRGWGGRYPGTSGTGGNPPF